MLVFCRFVITLDPRCHLTIPTDVGSVGDLIRATPKKRYCQAQVYNSRKVFFTIISS